MLSRYVPTNTPRAIGVSVFMLCFGFLRMSLMACIHLSYSFRTIRNIEPLTPGIILAIPTSTPLRKFIIFNFI